MTIRLGNSKWATVSKETMYGADLNDTFNATVPIGSVTAWLKNMDDVPALPANWVECNGQTISNANSPMNGKTVPNLNGTGRFLKGSSTSGSSADPEHLHQWAKSFSSSGAARPLIVAETLGTTGTSVKSWRGFNHEGNETDWGNSNNKLTGNFFTDKQECEPPHYTVVWIMKIY